MIEWKTGDENLSTLKSKQRLHYVTIQFNKLSGIKIYSGTLVFIIHGGDPCNKIIMWLLMKYRNSVTEVGNKKLVSNWIVTVEAMISLVESVTESSNMKESISTGLLTSYHHNSSY